MITLEQLFGPWIEFADATIERRANAARLLERVNLLLAEARAAGVPLLINQRTGSRISGGGLGGFRPETCSIGAPNSAHKQGRAVDVFDARNELDAWLDDAKLEQFGLYREHPSATRGWCHLTDRAPGSRRRTFMP
jgi:hypothetical protein